MLRIAAWNVNSIRARFDRLMAWLEKAAPDIVCLQELKVAEEEFPFDPLWREGWNSAVLGQPTYNGVAIIARGELTEVAKGFADGAEDDQARLIAATVGGIRVVSVYVPNGQTVGSDKWDYKLEWLARLGPWLDNQVMDHPRLVLAGDFNVAPEERDVARPEEWRDSVLCHEAGRVALRNVVTGRLVDTIRLHHEGPGPWSWWDYRMLGFPKGNGLRIDHIFASPALAERCRAASVDREERKGKLPSDHAPVIAEFDVEV